MPTDAIVIEASARFIKFVGIYFFEREWIVEEGEVHFYIMGNVDGCVASSDSGWSIYR